METASITRSPGTPTGDATIPLCGNGMTGATAELDATVQAGAELLAREFAIPVTIRFNSNRLSGGAWLVTSPGPDRIGTNTDIEIGGSLYPDPTDVEALYTDPSLAGPERRKRLDALPRTLRINAYASDRVLKNPALADCGGGEFRDYRRYARPQFPTPEAALAWLAEHIDRERVAVIQNLPGRAIPAGWVANRWAAWCESAWTRAMHEFGELGGWAEDWGGYPQSKSAIGLTFALWLPNGSKLPCRYRLIDIKHAITAIRNRTAT